jgi:hypothetical protein
MSGSLLTQPLRLGFRGAGLLIHETVSVSQRVLRLLGLPGAPAQRPGGTRTEDPPEAPIAAPPVATPPVATPPVATPPAATPPAAARTIIATPPVATAPIATEPAHVSESPELVEEIAEPGAEDGAGAQVRIAEPWKGYRLMTAADIIDHLASASRAELATVELYELAGRRRKSVVAAAQRALKQASPPG